MTTRVLLAEDEPNISTSLTFLLERAGHEVKVETDGDKALETALSGWPAILVLDVMLPSLDGYEILRRLRDDVRTKNLPVIMLTAKGQREDRETAIKCGANLFITKPFSNAEIVDAIKDLATAVSE